MQPDIFLTFTIECVYYNIILYRFDLNFDECKKTYTIICYSLLLMVRINSFFTLLQKQNNLLLT